MNNKVIEIELNNLLVNIENPRFEPVLSQQAAIIEMAKDQEKNLFNLGKSIINEGLNPSELPIVIPDSKKQGKYIVLEGNRRITTIKILKQPELIQPLKTLYNNFLKLQKDFKQKNLRTISCVVIEDLEKAYQWIELKHTGINKGVGTVSWNSKQIKRFKSQRGKSSYVLQLLEFVKNMDNLDQHVFQQIDNISITNLERLLGDPYIREFLGIENKNGVLQSSIPEDELKKGLKKIITDLSLKKINVNNIRTKQDRQLYVETFNPEETPQKTGILSTPWLINFKDSSESNSNPTIFDFNTNNKPVNEQSVSLSNTADSSQKEKQDDSKEETVADQQNTRENKPLKDESQNRKPRSNRLSLNRKYLIPSNCILKISHTRINNIYHELKKLEVNGFENSIAILFRVFAELNLDYFGETKKIDTFNINDKLHQKIQKIADYMESNKILSKYELKSIRVSTSSTNNLFSTNTLNAYVHNKDVIPKEDDLKATWDNFQKFIDAIWKTDY